MQKKIVIIGASAAGLTAAQKLRQLLPEAHILLITQESLPLYNKCLLADWCATIKTAQDVELITKNSLLQQRIELRTNTIVSLLDVPKQQVILSDGQLIFYDVLLLCTGSSAFIPPIINQRNGMQGVFSFHTYQDIESINSYIQQKSVKKVTIVGAGLTGLEAADAFVKRGLEVSLVDQAAQPLQLIANNQVSQYITHAMEAAGVLWYSNVHVIDAVFDESDTITNIQLSKGDIPTDLLVWACGVRPNSQFLQNSGISLYKNKWIQVDEFLRTTIENIYACGDVIVTKNCITQEPYITSSWPDAVMQGLTVAKIIAGIEGSYKGVLPYAHSSFFGLHIAWGGVMAITSENNQVAIQTTITAEGSEYLFYKDSLLHGFMQIGKHIEPGLYKRQLMNNFIRYPR